MIPSCGGQEKVLRFYREHGESSFYDEKSTRYFLPRLSLDFRGNKKEKKKKKRKRECKEQESKSLLQCDFFFTRFYIF